MDLAPITLALAARGLSTVNPCGFAMLPAYLALFVGAGDDQPPSASSRAALGLKTGLLVTGGFLVVFAIVGIPLTYGATQIVRGVPWAGIAVGAILVGVGVATPLGSAPRGAGRRTLTVTITILEVRPICRTSHAQGCATWDAVTRVMRW